MGYHLLQLRIAIPRLKLRRKTATETIDPLLQEITRVVNLASTNCARDDCREVLSAVASLAGSTLRWIDSLDINRAAAEEAKVRLIITIAVSQVDVPI